MEFFEDAELDTPDLEEMGIEEESYGDDIDTELSSVFNGPDKIPAMGESVTPAPFEGNLPVSNVYEAVDGSNKVSTIEQVDTTSPDIGSDGVYNGPDNIPGMGMPIKPAPYEGNILDYDMAPVQGAVNSLFGQFGLEQEPVPVDPMMAMVQQSQQAQENRDMAGLYPIREELMPMAVDVLSASFTSLNESGVVLSHQDRLAYASAVMKENDALPSGRKAQFLNSFMKNGKIVPELLPPDWYLSRGAMLKQEKARALTDASSKAAQHKVENQQDRQAMQQIKAENQNNNKGSQNGKSY